MVLTAVTPARVGPVADSVANVPVGLPQATDVVMSTMGSKVTHLEFESRDGIRTYESIVETKGGP